MGIVTFMTLWGLLLFLHFLAYPLYEHEEDNDKDKCKKRLIPIYPIRKFLENIIIPLAIYIIWSLIKSKI